MWIDAGINDFRSGTDVDLTDDVEAIRANVDAMVDFAERSGRNIILLSLTADNYSTEFLGGIRYTRILELNNHWSQNIQIITRVAMTASTCAKRWLLIIILQ